jgi:hypothetical protein
MYGTFVEIPLIATDGNRWVASGVHADEESETIPSALKISAMSLEFCVNH